MYREPEPWERKAGCNTCGGWHRIDDGCDEPADAEALAATREGAEARAEDAADDAAAERRWHGERGE